VTSDGSAGIPIDLAPAADQLRRLAAGVTSGDMAGPTPCADWTVRQLVTHILELAVAFRAAADKAPLDPHEATADIDDDGAWRDELDARLDRLVSAWQRPEAWTGMAEAGGVTMPAELTGMVAVDELVLHGWDLARATGQPFTCDDASLTAVQTFTGMMTSPEQRAGLFGPPVDVPSDASDLDRTVAQSGRDPSWTP
jgi:uncharacterized protein (TIGR03086 family)